MTAVDSSAIVVASANGAAYRRATQVAGELGLPVVKDWRTAPALVALVIDVESASLQLLGDKPPGPVTIDFANPAMEYRRKGGQNELLGRAVGVRQGRDLSVFDATAGLGRDAFVLADLGCRVLMRERSPALAWLLGQALDSADISASEHVREAAKRMQVQSGDSRLCRVPDGAVIYLDPMFPERRNNAAVKKDLAVLQALHGSDNTCNELNEHSNEQLFLWALEQPTPRIVVKRPLKAPALARKKPSHAVSGKAVRFDVYVLGDLP